MVNEDPSLDLQVSVDNCSNSIDIDLQEFSFQSDAPSNESYKNEKLIYPIPVIIGNRPAKTTFERRPPEVIKIKPNLKERIAGNFPVISIINARSLWPKLETFSIKFNEYVP